MRKSDIYRQIDEAEPLLRYRLAKDLKTEYVELAECVDKAMEVHIESDLESKNTELRSLACMERLRISSNTKSQNVTSELLNSKVISLTHESSKSGWIVFLKQQSVVYVAFDGAYNMGTKNNIKLDDFVQISNPLRSLFSGCKLNSRYSTKKILKTIQRNTKKKDIICNEP